MEKSLMKHPFLINADVKCLLEKMSTCYNNPVKSPTTKENKHTASDDSMFTHCSLYAAKNKLHCNRSKDCMERFCEDLKEYVTRIINYEKKETIPLTEKEKKRHCRQKNVILTTTTTTTTKIVLKM